MCRFFFANYYYYFVSCFPVFVKGDKRHKSIFYCLGSSRRMTNRFSILFYFAKNCLRDETCRKNKYHPKFIHEYLLKYESRSFKKCQNDCTSA